MRRWSALVTVLTLTAACWAAGGPPPTLTPNSSEAGKVLQVAVNAALSKDGRVDFEPAGNLIAVGLNTGHGSSGNELTFMLQVLPTAAPGPYTFVYTPPGNSPGGDWGSGPLRVNNAFTVTAPAPQAVTVTKLQPDHFTVGQNSISTQVTGTGLQAGAQLAFSGSGVTGTVTAVINSTTAMALVSVAQGAAAGSRTVQWTNPDSSNNASQSAAAQITVTVPQVAITSITPSTFTAGAPPVTATLTGTGFASGASIGFSGTGVSATVMSVVPPGTAMASISVQGGASAGSRSVSFTNLDGSSNGSQSPAPQITVTVPQVAITSITPSTFTAGAPPVTATLTGTGFAPGASIGFSGSGVSATVMSVVPPGTAMASISAQGGASAGSRSVSFTNLDGSSNASQSPAAQITVTVPQVAITSITPSTFTAGAPPVTATLTGTGFAPGASIGFSGSGVSATVMSVVPPGTAMVSISVQGGSSAGSRSVSFTNLDGSSNGSQSPAPQITVTVPQVAITSITPSTFTAGAPPVTATLTGTGFAPGASIGFSGSGVSATVMSVVPPGTAMASISVQGGASAGSRSVSLTNLDGSSNGSQSPAPQITVTVPQVAITSITPSTFTAGDPPVSVQISGTGLQPGAGVSISGDGVTTTVMSVVPPGTAMASISVQLGASAGVRTVTITNPDATSNASQSPMPQVTIVRPRVTIGSINPSTFVAGDPPATVQVSGTGLQPGATLSVAGDGVAATVMNVNPPGTAMASIVAQLSASAGARAVTVTNPDATSNASQSPMPQITIVRPRVTIGSINPSTVVAGDPSASVQISGTGLQPGATLSVGGDGVAATVVSVNPPGSAMATITAAWSAAAGSRTVTISNPDGSSNVSQIPAPRITVVRPRVTITAITPSSFAAGDSPVVVQLAGTGILPGATLAVGGDGVTAAVGTVTPPNGASATIAVSPLAALGQRPVTLSNTDGTSNASQAPMPQISIARRIVVVRSISPETVAAGESGVTVQLTGTGFLPGATVALGDGVTATIVSVNPPNGATAVVNAAATAKPGARAVVIANTDGSSSEGQSTPLAFKILPPRVIIRAVQPRSMVAGGLPLTAHVSGQGFQDGATLVLGVAGVSVKSFKVKSSTTAVAAFLAGEAAKPGTYAVTIINPDESSNAKQSPPATVTIAPKGLERVLGPRVDQIAPSLLEPGKIYDVDVLGKNLTPAVAISFGPDVTVYGAPIVPSPTQATLKIQVSPAALPGTRAALASDATGSNEGPGGVYIEAARPPAVGEIPVAAAPAAVVVAGQARKVKITFAPPPSGFSAMVQRRLEGKKAWVAIAGPTTKGFAYDEQPVTGRCSYRVVYQDTRGTPGEPSATVELFVP